MNSKLKTAIITSMIAAVSLTTAAPAIAASYDGAGNKVGFFERVGLMLGFKKELTPEQKAQRIKEMKQKHEARLNARLDALVAEGKITEAQKIELKAKFEALEQAKFNSVNLTKEEKRQATKQAREDIKSWAQSNGLELGQLMPKRNHDKHRMMQNQ